MARQDGLALPNNDCIQIDLQDGPIKQFGVNGCQIDDVVKWCITVMQQMNDNFPCRQNSLAITKLEEAALWLEHRTRERTQRQVEGTNVA